MRLFVRRILCDSRRTPFSTKSPKESIKDVGTYGDRKTIELCGRKISEDDWTNITPRILDHIGRNIYLQKNHPLSILRQKIIDYFYSNYLGHRGTPVFSVYETLSPLVTTVQNFDSLLIEKDHPSRRKSDCYYIDRDHLLRAHMTAHQAELIKSGLDRFLMIGDVYRRDEIDATHYPVFHQVDAVRLFTGTELHGDRWGSNGKSLFGNGTRTHDCQECHDEMSVKLVEMDLKTCLMGLTRSLFGKGISHRWTETYFPFTHPSWELEIDFNGEWMEVLGCGVVEQSILKKAGASDRIGWAFGLGLERLAMLLFNIPDIRLFWSKDSGFLSQFKEGTITKYKPISQFPQCINDISFWLPNDKFSANDFYDLVRVIGGDIVEQVSLVDEFTHPKSGKKSHCYRIVYRHMEKTLTQEEVNAIHSKIEKNASETLGVIVR
ncbi:hypothetical protein J437_LFUL015053 [Ladona fulva]|uniref:Phenylalanine--tRNA ligase, mitochondrial n=1 Tax=Ladona fulva TaxID=123851 RepID=A0A8K0K5T7_LADFU|nr:hypothetical protein J437_LFUL015053 [Ladona fulva]